MNLRPLCEGVGFAALIVAGLLVAAKILHEFEYIGAMALIAAVALIVMVARAGRGI